jgi:DNA-binding HxlR family transcriptional regulator
VAAGEATGSRFRARAGALTLLYVAGSLDRGRLLELLEEALSGRLPPVPDEEEVEEYEEELEEGYEDEELEDEELDDGEDEEEELDDGAVATLPPILRRVENPIGPHTPLRTASKGDEFLFVAAAMERWLRNCPQEPLHLGLRGARALAPLICGWSATVTHALAPEPLTLAELDRAVGLVDRDVAVAHVESLERSGQVEALPGGGETRYALTDWGREGISPIVAAVRYECHYPQDDVLPPDVFDVEAGFQMALPLLRLPPGLRGDCRLGVQIPGDEPLMAGATAQVDRGVVVSSSPLLDKVPGTWASGTPLDWCEAVVDPSATTLESGGDAELTGALIEALHERLFGEGDG